MQGAESMKDHKGYVVAPALGLVLLASCLFAQAPASPQRTFASPCSIVTGETRTAPIGRPASCRS